MMKSLFRGCNQISNTSLITCRTFPTCSPHNNQSLHDKPPARVAGVLVRNMILVRAFKFSRESVLAVLSVHLRIAGRRHGSYTLLKASLYARRITCARGLHWYPRARSFFAQDAGGHLRGRQSPSCCVVNRTEVCKMSQESSLCICSGNVFVGYKTK